MGDIDARTEGLNILEKYTVYSPNDSNVIVREGSVAIAGFDEIRRIIQVSDYTRLIVLGWFKDGDFWCFDA